MLNIEPDLELFSLGEPGGPVSIHATTPPRRCAGKASAGKPAKRACGASRKNSRAAASRLPRAPAASSLPPACDGPSGPAPAAFDGPSGPVPAVFDGPSGPMPY